MHHRMSVLTWLGSLLCAFTFCAPAVRAQDIDVLIKSKENEIETARAALKAEPFLTPGSATCKQLNGMAFYFTKMKAVWTLDQLNKAADKQVQAGKWTKAKGESFKAQAKAKAGREFLACTLPTLEAELKALEAKRPPRDPEWFVIHAGMGWIQISLKPDSTSGKRLSTSTPPTPTDGVLGVSTHATEGTTITVVMRAEGRPADGWQAWMTYEGRGWDGNCHGGSTGGVCYVCREAQVLPEGFCITSVTLPTKAEAGNAISLVGHMTKLGVADGVGVVWVALDPKPSPGKR
jgi:hypothetical protein